jgi:ABC-2 type transport system permease protein
MKTSPPFAGTGALLRLAIRRDRVLWPGWLLVLVFTASSSARATAGLYPDESARLAAAKTFNSSQALIAMYGRIYDPTSLGALAMLKLGGIGAVCVALLAILNVMRHTRAEEESGRQELLGATPIGRRAALTAAMLLVIGGNLVLGVLTGAGLAGSGLPAGGSFAFGLEWAAVGIAFAAVAAFTAQLTSSARTASGLAVAFLGVVYVLRAVGDTAGPGGPRWLTWLSPVGWAQQLRPYQGDRWWILLITLGFAVVLTGFAYALAGRRDVGAGLLPDRSGPAEAGASLRGPIALAWRLQRTLLLAWAVGFAVLGLVLGTIATQATGFLGSSQSQQFIAELGGKGALVDSYLAAMMGIAGIIAAAYGVQAASYPHSEESAGRAETLLATPVSRTRWMVSHLPIALAGTALLLVIVGSAAGASYAGQAGDWSQFGRVLAGALVDIPAAWVLVGLVAAGFGLVPRIPVFGWGLFTAFILLGEVGPLLKLNHWAMDVSPFAHVPHLPGGPVGALPLLALLAVALLGTIVGLASFRRRDVPAT